MTLKIALVHDFVVRYGGAEKLLHSWAEIFPDAPIFTLIYNQKTMGDVFPIERIHSSYLQKYYSITKRYTWLLPFMSQAIESFDLSEYDIIISSSSAFSHGVLTHAHQKHISYIHSPMRWAWDYHFTFIKERKMGLIQKLLFQKIMSKIRIWDELTSSRPDVLLAASTEVQKRIQKYWRRKSDILFPFVDIQKFTIPKEKDSEKFLEPKKKYYIIVSQLVPYKRIDIAIQACELLQIPLKIIGRGVMREELEKMAGPYTEFLGEKQESALISYLQEAEVFLFPGCDDFGMAPIEAMACGIPVVAYKKAGALDTVKEGVSGVFFTEQTLESLKNILMNTDFSQFDAQKIRDVAKNFSRVKHLQSLKKYIEK
jgi:glycosyltransferase involved in cell wall biosynthesis